jgi:hypothetical protein
LGNSIDPDQQDPTWVESSVIILGIEDSESELEIPESYVLFQNYPNPFNPTTTIRFNIPTSPLNPSPYQGEGNRERLVTLKVYDILGSEVATLVNEKIPAGSYEIEFNVLSHSGASRNLPSGVYFYQLRVNPVNGGAGNYTETKKMLLIK